MRLLRLRDYAASVAFRVIVRSLSLSCDGEGSIVQQNWDKASRSRSGAGRHVV